MGLGYSSSCSAYRSRHTEYNNVASSNENPDLVFRFEYSAGRCSNRSKPDPDISRRNTTTHNWVVFTLCYICTCECTWSWFSRFIHRSVAPRTNATFKCRVECCWCKMAHIEPILPLATYSPAHVPIAHTHILI